MAERGQNLVGGAQIFVDRLGFRRQLHNDDIHVIPMAYGKNKGGFRENFAAHRFDPNMGGEAAPVKSADVEQGPRKLYEGSTLYLRSYEIRPRVAPPKRLFLGNILCDWMQIF